MFSLFFRLQTTVSDFWFSSVQCTKQKNIWKIYESPLVPVNFRWIQNHHHEPAFLSVYKVSKILPNKSEWQKKNNELLDTINCCQRGACVTSSAPPTLWCTGKVYGKVQESTVQDQYKKSLRILSFEFHFMGYILSQQNFEN